MRFRARLVLIGLLVTSVPALAQSDSLSAEQREVLHVDSLRLAAVLRADTTLLKQLMTTDWLLISSVTGERLARAEYLSGLASGTRRLSAAAHDSVQVRIHGTAAVLTGRSTGTMRRQGAVTPVITWFTHVYVKDAGGWRMVSMHVSADPPASAPQD